MTFRKAIIATVRAIPSGQTRTYQEVAEAAGRPRAYRAVGNILHRAWQTDHGRTVPCHRVVRSDGTPGGYAGGPAVKAQLLRDERSS